MRQFDILRKVETMRRVLIGLFAITAALSCAAKVTVLPQYLQNVMSLLVTMQTILAKFRIAFFSLFRN